MPKQKLTARFIESVNVDTRTEYWDELIQGLFLRVSPAGRKTWMLAYNRPRDRKKIRLSIGNFPVVDLATARGKALKELARVDEGEDPAVDEFANMTVRQLGELFVERYAKRNKRTWAEDQRIFDVEINPTLGDTFLAKMKRSR